MTKNFERTERDFHGFEMCDSCWNGHHKHHVDKVSGEETGCTGFTQDGKKCKCPHHSRVKRKKPEKPEQTDLSQFGTIEVK